MQQAVVATAYGGPEVIDLVHMQSVAAGEGEIVVAVEAAALNPWDARIAAGALGLDPAALPIRLGMEATGRVVSVGPRALAADGTALHVGDPVVGAGLRGALATELTAPSRHFVARPSTVSLEQAAGLLVVGGVAEHILGALNVVEGETLLVHGVAGGVGAMVARLALARGATVVGTAAPRRHDRLRRLGVHPVEYGPGLERRIRTAVDTPIDAAADTVGTDEALESSRALLGELSRFASIVNLTGALAAGGKALGHAPGADPGDAVRASAIPGLVERASNGLQVDIAGVFPFASAREAFDLLATGHAGGKVILAV